MRVCLCWVEGSKECSGWERLGVPGPSVSVGGCSAWTVARNLAGGGGLPCEMATLVQAISRDQLPRNKQRQVPLFRAAHKTSDSHE